MKSKTTVRKGTATKKSRAAKPRVTKAPAAGAVSRSGSTTLLGRRGFYKSPALAAIHETVSDLHSAGLADKKTMRRFDELCLTPVEKLSAGDIKKIREEAQLSQAVFARYLNVSTSVVTQWERGEKSPAGPSLKLLTLAQKKGIDAIA